MTEEVKDDVTQEVQAEPTAEVESSTTEQTTGEVTTDVATTEEAETVETKTEQAETEATEEAPAESEPEETLAPKSQNRFQKLANENRDLKNKLAQLEELQVPTEQDYLDGGYDPIEAKVNAMQAQLSQRDAIERVTSLNMAIDNDMGRIIHEYPQLDPKSSEFNKDLAIALFTQYDKDSGAQYGKDGVVLETNQLPYEYINNKMQLVGIASKKAEAKAQKSVEKMVAQAETPAGSPPKEAKDMTIAEMEAQYGIVRN